LDDLAGSSATKKTRARQILKSPAKRVSCNLLYAFNWQNKATKIPIFGFSFWGLMWWMQIAVTQANTSTPTCTPNQWQWMQPPWMQPGVMAQQMQRPPGAMGQVMDPTAGMIGQQGPWMMGQHMPWMMGQQYPGQWISQPPPMEQATKNTGKCKPESEARATRRAARKEVQKQC
jgi:hypothetical protein